MAVLLMASVACHRNRDVATDRLTASADGAYRFLIDVPDIYLTGRFVVADTQVFLEVDSDCAFVEAPNASDGMHSTWYECDRTAEGAFLQLRISQLNPVKKSLWYARIRVLDSGTRCTRYSIRGDCMEGYGARGTKWVERYGAMIITRGLPGAPPDSSAPMVPRGSRPLRVRCDTTAFSKGCDGAPRIER